MELLFFALLATLSDPIRWIVCILPAWFIRNYAGALAVGISVSAGLAVVLSPRINAPNLLVGAVASAIIVSIFYFWRKSRRNNAIKHEAPPK